VRTDVWAFGCVLYEMLTARPAFGGRSVSEVVAAVLRDDPDWGALPPRTPRSIERLLRRCLRRYPRMRLQHIGDARLEILDTEDAPAGGVRHLERSPWRQHAGWLVAALATALSGALLLLRSPLTADPPPLTRLSVELPPHVTMAGEFAAPFAIAPSGASVVLEGVEGTTSRLFVRDLASSALRTLPGTDGAAQPFFSPDGAWIGFFAQRKLWKVPASGGPPQQLADIGGNPRGASWASDGTIVVAPTQTAGLVRIPDSGGRPMPLTTLDVSRAESSHRWPDVLPGGKWALFTVGLEEALYDEAHIDAVSLATGERRTIVERAGFARFMPKGLLLFIRGGLLHAVSFDPDRLAMRGTPQAVLDPVRYDWRNGGSHLSVAGSGALLYTPGQPSSSDFFLAWAGHDGGLTRVGDTPRLFRDVRISPDGQRIATAIGTSTESDLWIAEPNGALSRLTTGMSPRRPEWTPSGTGITVAAVRDGVWRLITVDAGGTRDPIVLFESAHRLYPNAWSPDGRSLVFQESRPESGWDLRVLDIDPSGRPVGAPRVFASATFHESSAAISRDGRWIAYESDELDGVVQVYVRSFPDGAHKVRASADGARWPTWDALGQLHFWETPDNSLRTVRTREKAGQLLLDPPQVAWSGEAEPIALRRVVLSVAGARFDVDPRGTRFLVLERSTTPSAPSLSLPTVLLGWTFEPRE
jgi:serine/threonine-protein kinase